MKIHFFWFKSEFLFIVSFDSSDDVGFKVLVDVDGCLCEDDVFHGLEVSGMYGFEPELSEYFEFIDLVEAFLV
jgi:hypothetical protein